MAWKRLFLFLIQMRLEQLCHLIKQPEFEGGSKPESKHPNLLLVFLG